MSQSSHSCGCLWRRCLCQASPSVPPRNLQELESPSAWSCPIRHPFSGLDHLSLEKRDPSPFRVRVRFPSQPTEPGSSSSSLGVSMSSRFVCPFPPCNSDYSSLQGLCSHLEIHHLPQSTVPQPTLDSLQRWVCCQRLFPLNKACRQCQKAGPRQKRPPPPGPGGSPPSKAQAFEPAEVPPKRALLTTLPLGVKSNPGQLPHHGPFPQCAQSTGYGAGWLTPRELFLHLNSVHL